MKFLLLALLVVAPPTFANEYYDHTTPEVETTTTNAADSQAVLIADLKNTNEESRMIYGGSVGVPPCNSGTSISVPGASVSSSTKTEYCMALDAYNSRAADCARAMFLPQYDTPGGKCGEDGALCLKKLNPACKDKERAWIDVEKARRFAKPNIVYRFIGKFLLPKSARGPIDGS